MKKLAKVIAVICIVFFTFTITREITIRSQSPIILGDVNDDGKINGYDVLLIKRDLLDIKKLDKSERLRADMNGDGEITLIDMGIINKYVINMTK